MKEVKDIEEFKPIPKFKNEDEERKFWSKNDSMEYIDWNTAQRVVFSNLKYSTESISIRMPIINPRQNKGNGK